MAKNNAYKPKVSTTSTGKNFTIESPMFPIVKSEFTREFQDAGEAGIFSHRHDGIQNGSERKHGRGSTDGGVRKRAKSKPNDESSRSLKEAEEKVKEEEWSTEKKKSGTRKNKRVPSSQKEGKAIPTSWTVEENRILLDNMLPETTGWTTLKEKMGSNRRADSIRVHWFVLREQIYRAICGGR